MLQVPYLLEFVVSRFVERLGILQDFSTTLGIGVIVRKRIHIHISAALDEYAPTGFVFFAGAKEYVGVRATRDDMHEPIVRLARKVLHFPEQPGLHRGQCFAHGIQCMP